MPLTNARQASDHSHACFYVVLHHLAGYYTGSEMV